MIALWDDTKFQILSVEYGYGWIGLYGQNMQSGFICDIVGIPLVLCPKNEIFGTTCVSSDMPFLFRG